MAPDRQQAHQLLDQLAPDQVAAVVHLLKVMVDEDELTEEDRQAVIESRHYFKQGGEGLSLEQVAAECGISPDKVRSTK